MRNLLPIIAFTLAFLLGGRAEAFTVKTTSEGDYVFWNGGGSTIFLELSAPAGVIGEPELEVLAEALRAWEDLSQGAVRFVFAGRGKAEPGRDGRNLLSWVEDWGYDPRELAVTTIWFDPATGRTREVDIEFNARDFAWPVSTAASSDLLEVALHEIGHLLGIGHSFHPGAAMHGRRLPTAARRIALTRDDLDALAFLYPVRSLRCLLFDLDGAAVSGASPAPRPQPGPPFASFRRGLALAALDADGDGVVSELATAWRDHRGRGVFECRRLFSPGPRRNPPVGSRGYVSAGAAIVSLTGADLDRDGRRDELGVLVREGSQEKVWFYDPLSPQEAPLASLDLGENALSSVLALDFFDHPHSPALAVLSASSAGYLVSVYPAPRMGEHLAASAVRRLPLPGFGRESRLGGMAWRRSGEEEEVFLLECPLQGQAWVHVFALRRDEGGMPDDLEYRDSFSAGPGDELIPLSRMALVESPAGEQSLLLLERR